MGKGTGTREVREDVRAGTRGQGGHERTRAREDMHCKVREDMHCKVEGTREMHRKKRQR